MLGTGFDLKVFFTFVVKDPLEVTTADVLDFITDQRAPRRGSNVVRLEDGESGLSARTVRRRPLSDLPGRWDRISQRLAHRPPVHLVLSRQLADRQA